MSTERVDKQWKSKGLGGYSTAAILGTLSHYGAPADEGGFKTLAEHQFPLQIAGGWRLTWKGTGPFAQFPYAAAEELMRRLLPDRVTPAKLAEALVTLLGKSATLVSGQEASVEEAFVAAEKLAVGMPPVGETRSLFASELVTFLDRFAQAFEDLPRALHRHGHPTLATRAATLQETVFPERRGVVTALIKADDGARDEAVATLSELTLATEGRTLFSRYWALDALSQLDATDALKRAGLPLFDDAASANQWPLADSAIHLMARLLERSPTLKSDTAFVEAVVSRFEEAHRRVGHHGH